MQDHVGFSEHGGLSWWIPLSKETWVHTSLPQMGPQCQIQGTAYPRSACLIDEHVGVSLRGMCDSKAAVLPTPSRWWLVGHIRLRVSTGRGNHLQGRLEKIATQRGSTAVENSYVKTVFVVHRTALGLCSCGWRSPDKDSALGCGPWDAVVSVSLECVGVQRTLVFQAWMAAMSLAEVKTIGDPSLQMVENSLAVWTRNIISTSECH